MAKFAKIIHQYNENFLIKKFISLFVRKLNDKKKGRFSLVLAGGKSPIKLYKHLATNKKINWKKVDFFISDERCVKNTSINSNIRMCKKNLLNKIKVSNSQIYEIYTESKSPKKISIKYERRIKKYFLNKKIVFDLIVLGIGKDGHIASLFKKNIDKKSNKIVDFLKKNNLSRVTLTLKCINNAKSIFLWAPGKKKFQIIKKILLDEKLKYPASFLKYKNNYLFNCN